MAVESKQAATVNVAIDQQMELLSLSYAERDREGADEQNGTTDAKKQSSSSQAEELCPEQRRLMGHSSSGNLFPPHGDIKKSSSVSSVSSHKSQPARKPAGDRFDEVRERRMQLEEQRRAALEKQIGEKEKRRQRAQEVKKVSPVRPQPTKSSGKQATPSIVVQPVTTETKQLKTKPPPLVISTGAASSGPSITSPNSKRPKSPTTPISPRSPGLPKSPTTSIAPRSPTNKKVATLLKKNSPTKRISPPGGKPRRISPPGRKQSPPGKKVHPLVKKPNKQTVSMVRREFAEKKQRLSLTPPIVEVVEPQDSPPVTGAPQSGSSTDVASCSSLSIYYRPRNKKKKQETYLTSSDTDEPSNVQQQRRLTLQERQKHEEERKSSHPNMKFHPVEYGEPRQPYKPITTYEHEKRKNKRGASKNSAVANMISMRSDGKDCAGLPNNLTGSAPVSRITTPAGSPHNSPKRNKSVNVQLPTPEHKVSPLIHQTSIDTKTSSMATLDEEMNSQVSVITDIKAPAPTQMGARRRTMSGSSDDLQKVKKVLSSRNEDNSDGEDTDASDFPPSNFELRPQEACLYAIYNSDSTSESEMFLMALSDEQILQIEIISTLPQAMEQLIFILPVIQQYLDKGATAFKALSAVEPDDSRCCYIISPAVTPSSSASNRSSLSSIDF